MADSTLITRLLWITLPNGVRRDAAGRSLLRLSVRLAPRVENVATLAACPLLSGSDGSGPWTTKARQCRFTVSASADGGTAWAGVRRSGDSVFVPLEPTLPDDAVWRALMPDAMAIEPHAAPVPSATAQSYGVRVARDALLEPLHAGGSIGPTAQDAVEPAWTRLFPASVPAAAALRRVTTALHARHGTPSRAQIAAAASEAGLSAEALEMDRMASFYDGLSQGARDRYEDAKNAGFEQAPPRFDFHAAVAIASRYPALMRALGLLFDLELPLDELALPAGGWLRVQLATPAASAPGATEPVLATRYAVGPGERFVSVSRDDFAPDSDLKDGLLVPSGDDPVCSVDVNLSELHHGLRRTAARYHAERARGASIADALASAPLPVPHSDGLALARDAHAARLVALMRAQSGLEAGLTGADETHPLRLGAEQLLQGFRVDIRAADDKAWRSLCRREGRYVFTAAGFNRDWPADEGTIGFHAFDPTRAGGPQSGLWAHETWFRWQGWSLAAPRPGRHIGIDGQSRGNADQATGALGLDVQFTAPAGSLPRLRFGRNYDCRLRAVDLAGNGPGPGDAIPDGFALPLGPYLRFDPVAAPVLLAPTVPGPGESIDRLVIHGDGSTPSTETAERLLAPPKTTQLLAEWHGQFDGAAGEGAQAWARLVGRDGQWPEAPAPGLFGDTPPPLPYLPDPMARQASLDFRPELTAGVGAPPVHLPFDGTWPDLKPLRLSMVEGEGEPQWDAAARRLTVPVPAGQARDLDLCSMPADGDGDGFALFDWWQDLHGGERLPRNIAWNELLARWGRVRELTPSRRLRLVNAVQRPLLQPDFSATPMGVVRQHGETRCHFFGTTAVHVPSTLKLEIMASWDEAVDNGVDPPSRQAYSMLAYRRDVAPDEKSVGSTAPWSWDLADDHPGGNYLLPFHEFRDTRHRRVTYRTVATSRYAEYFGAADDGGADRFTRVSVPTTLEVPASARPLAPKVLRVVPMLRWEEQVDAQGVRTRVRHGGVRVVMDRPWFSSGDGEQLGIMLLADAPDALPPSLPDPGPGAQPKAAASGPVAPALLPLVTQWGTDPVTGGAELANPLMPTPGQFTNAVSVTYGVGSPDSAVSGPFAVVAFDVRFEPPDPAAPDESVDPARHPHDGHWVADIDLDPGGAVHPFLRMALVRFQPLAVWGDGPDQRVSAVVLADCVQLAPRRSLSLAADSSNARAVRLTLAGTAFGTDTKPTRCTATMQADLGSAGAPMWMDFGETPLTPGVSTLLTLPFARDTRPMRAVVREFDQHQADGLQRSNIGDDRSVERLVYVDVITIGVSGS